MSRPVWLYALLLFGFGAFAYGAVVSASARRAWRAHRDPAAAQPLGDGTRQLRFWTPDMLMSVLSLVWFLVNLALLVTSLDPAIDTSALQIVAMVLSFAFPPAILYYRSFAVDGGTGPTRVQRLVTLGVALASTLTVVVTLGTIVGFIPWRDESALRVSTSILGVLFLVAFVGAAVWRSPRRDRRDGAAGVLTVRVLSLVAAVLSVPLAIHVISGWRSPDIPLLLLQSMPLFFLVVTSYHEERFEFFDLIVKRGLALVVSLLAAVAWFAYVAPALAKFGPDDLRPWLLALAVLPLLWGLPWIRGAIGRLVDRYLLGRQYSTEQGYAALVDRVLRAMEPTSTEAQLVEEVARCFSEFFNAQVSLRLAPDPDDEPAAPATIRVPVRAGDERVGVLELGPRARQMPWLSEDLALVAILADVCGFQVTTVRLREREALQAQRAQAMELHASRSRLQALRAQVNPHFLFNALNAIAGLIHRDPELADRTVEQLAEVFRYTLRQSENEWVPFGEELTFVRAYLDVERARFGGRLTVVFDVERAPAHAHVPALALQTLVENAVKHGVARTRGAASVHVTAWADASTLVIDVADNGAGFAPEGIMGRLPPSRESGRFGLRSLQERLSGYFGSRAGLTWRREDGRTHVCLTLPLVERELGSSSSGTIGGTEVAAR